MLRLVLNNFSIPKQFQNTRVWTRGFMHTQAHIYVYIKIPNVSCCDRRVDFIKSITGKYIMRMHT